LNILAEKFRDVIMAVFPITVIVLILHFTVSPLTSLEVGRFLLGAALIIVGFGIFLVGADVGISPMGAQMGQAIAKSNKIWIVIVSGLVLGFMISFAEPVLHILGGQVEAVTGGVLPRMGIVLAVSVGVALVVALGLLRIVTNVPLRWVLTGAFGLVFLFSLFSTSEFLAIAFDGAASVTGAIIVPFMLALALGVSSLKAGKAAGEDSFGLVGLIAPGAILSVLVMNFFARAGELSGSVESVLTETTSVLQPFLKELPVVAVEVLLTLVPLLVLFCIFNHTTFKLSRRKFNRILIGLLFTFVGLSLFLTGVNAGFMAVATKVGYNLAVLNGSGLVIFIGFILGLAVILAEPAVYVLTEQIETVTSGYLKRPVIVTTLAIGVAAAVVLCMIRILVPHIQLWYYLLPGYIISITMAYYVPNLFVGIAFDSGGVASGPMTATFVLAFAQGVAQAIEGANVLIDGFGVIATVAMTPLIAVQALGLIFKLKAAKGGGETSGE